MRGNGASFLGEGGCRGFFSSYDRKLGVPLELQRGSQGTFQVAYGESGPLFSCKGELGIALKSLQWNPASSRIEGEILWFSSSCGGKHRVPLELQRGSQGTSRVAKRESSLHSGCRRLLGIALELLWGKRALSRIEG